MNIELDHVVAAVPSLAALEPFERLGLRLTPPGRHPGLGTANRAFFTGGAVDQAYVEFLALADRAEAEASGARANLLAALDAAQSLYRIVFRTSDLDAAIAARPGVFEPPYEPRRDDGSAIGRVASVRPGQGLGCDAGLIEYAPGIEARREKRVADGLTTHAVPLRRMDHLAVIAPDLPAAALAWEAAFGLTVSGEIHANGMHILQLRAGSVVVELIGPDTPESPLAARPAGLVPMVAFEVPDLAAAVAHVESAGFTIAPPREGVIPGTSVTTVTGDQLGGLALQLLAYDRT
ncbi:MAG: VOC family protein [Dehalococcoidia bacterium]|nr:VOC family protein [Dehalococcoidia bacterium]